MLNEVLAVAMFLFLLLVLLDGCLDVGEPDEKEVEREE